MENLTEKIQKNLGKIFNTAETEKETEEPKILVNMQHSKFSPGPGTSPGPQNSEEENLDENLSEVRRKFRRSQ